MQKGRLPSILTSALLLCVALLGCKKENTLGIDNDKVISTPYSLFAADSSGAIVKTNDGSQFANVFPPDGYPPLLLLTSGPNLMMVKDNLHLSTNSGRDFNPVYTHLNKFPWQTMAIDYPEHDRVYITSTKDSGIVFSPDHGLTWMKDSLWAPATQLPPSFIISSFSGLKNGKLFAYSNEGNVLFLKDGPDGNWTPVTTEGSFPVGHSEYFLTSNNNTLFLIDHKGVGGAWYSEDEGIHWTKYNQGTLPLNTTYYCAIAPNPEGNTLLVGTASFGIFRAENGVFTASSGGLLTGASAYSLAAKDNYYKNNVMKHYIYVGTSDGMYRSENHGQTWYQLTSGVWKQKYVAIY